MSIITDRIRSAYYDHRRAMAAYDAVPFSFVGALDHPVAPAQSAEAMAGEMVVQQGMVGALVRCVGMGLDGTFDDALAGNYWRQVATLVTLAAQEPANA